MVTKDGYGINGLTKRAWYCIAIVTAIVLFFALCFRTVGAGQVGIITRFGDVNRVQTSGVAIKFPWPVERLEKMETRVQKEEQDASAATADLQDVNAKLALNYALDNETSLRVYKELGKDYKNRVITPALQESFKSSASGYTASELITRRAEVKNKAYEVIKARLDKYGIRIVDLNVVNFSFSQEFSKSIESKQVAAQNAERAKFDLERAITDAKAQEAQKTSLSPELLRKMELDNQAEAIRKWRGDMPQTVAGSNGAVFNIPLTR